MNQITKAINSVACQEDFDLTTSKSKEELAVALLKEEQTPCSIIHRFGPGIYIREAIYPPNTLIVGMEHTSEHYNILLKGSIRVINGEGQAAQLNAPFMFVAPPGSKVGYTLTEVVWQNIYATEERDIEKLEKTLFKAPQSCTDILKQKILDAQPLHEEDRKDFLLLCKETGWLEEDIATLSRYREDCIPFPYGNYALISGNSPIQGKGMFATASFSIGDTIAPMSITGKRTPAGYLVNHSKTPNCEAVRNKEGDLFLVAKTKIQGMLGGSNGDELTLDYRQVMKINNLYLKDTLCLPE